MALKTPEEALQKSLVKKGVVYTQWVDKKAVQWIRLTTKRRFRRTIKHARDVMNFGIKEGLTRKQMQKAMAKNFRKYNAYELDRVITTETTRAINLGTYQAEQKDSMVIGWQVVVNFTGCEICDAAANDGFIPKDKMDSGHIPPLHPNCECTLEPVFAAEPAATKYLKKHPEKVPQLTAEAVAVR